MFDEGAITSEKYFSVAVFEAEASDSETVEFVEFLFRRAGDLTQFTDAQLNKGFWHLTSPCLSNYMFPVRDGDVPLAKKLSAIDSIYSLYADCFAKRCTETLGHLSEKSSDLNPICYMFWDVCILTYLEKTSEETALAETVFSVLEIHVRPLDSDRR